MRQSLVRELSGSFCVFSPSSYVICTPREEQKLLPSLPVPAGTKTPAQHNNSAPQAFFSSILSLNSKKPSRSRTCDKAGSPWAVLGETAWQIDSAVPFFCFHLFCLCFCAFLRNLLSLRYFCSRRHGFQGVGAFMFYVVFVTRLPGCSISGVSRVNSCSVSAGFQVFLKQSFHFLRVRGIDDADTGIVDVDVLMPHAVDLPRFMYHDP